MWRIRWRSPRGNSGIDSTTFQTQEEAQRVCDDVHEAFPNFSYTPEFVEEKTA